MWLRGKGGILSVASTDKDLFPCHHRTFAYVTLKERMPKVLTQVIDTIHREEKSIYSQFGEVSSRNPAHTCPVSSCCKLRGAFHFLCLRQAAEKWMIVMHKPNFANEWIICSGGRKCVTEMFICLKTACYTYTGMRFWYSKALLLNVHLVYCILKRFA